LERSRSGTGRYPSELDDAKLDEVISGMLSAIPGFDRYNGILPELKLSLILIGAEERARRDADRVGKRLYYAALAAPVVALISLAVSLLLAAV
jgi:hypothetical protein